MRAALMLIILTLLLGAGLSALAFVSQGAIEEQQQLAAERRLLDLLPAGSYDNHPLQQPIILAAGGELANPESSQGYLARLHGQPTALVLPVTERGYEGPIQLLVAISPAGKIIASKVLHEQETQGLADFHAPARQAWLQTLNGRELAEPAQQWLLRADGGVIDQISGATRTSRAINQAQQRALRFFTEQRQQLLQGQP